MTNVTDLAEYRRRKEVEIAVAELRRDTDYWDTLWALMRAADLARAYASVTWLRDGPELPAA